MIIEVTNEKLDEIKIFPENELVEIAQNVKTILTTIKGEVFLDRTFGIAADLLDAPINVIQAQFTAKVADAVAKFEPRARVTDCLYSGDSLNGEVKVTVRLRIIEQNLKSPLPKN